MSTIEVLLRFSRMVAGADGADAILPVLANAVTSECGADAAAILRVTGHGHVEIVAGVGLPDDLAPDPLSAEIIGPELAEDLLARTGDRFAEAAAVPLIADGDLFGVLVLLLIEGNKLDAEHRERVHVLADLAAIAMSKAAKYEELSRAYVDLKASREALAQSQKLRALGQMAAGVTHDLKNVLNPLSLLLQLLRRRLQHGKDVEGVIDQFEEALQTGLDTVERLKGFSRQDPASVRKRIDLDRHVRRALEICRPRLSQDHGLRLVDELDANEVAVHVESSELTNAVVNLVLNAAEAMTDGGTVTVSSGADDECAWLRIEDDGPGMPPEVQRRVFEPFFTTKSQGTGLGLANVYAFVQRHGGRVDLDTVQGRGTRFTLRFPVAEG